MKEYDLVANKTRNLEQQYTSYIIKKFQAKIKQLETLSENTPDNKSLEIEILKKSNSELKKEIELKTKMIQEYESKLCKGDDEKVLQLNSIIDDLKRNETANLKKIEQMEEKKKESKLSDKDIKEIKNTQKEILKNFNLFISNTESTLQKLETQLDTQSLLQIKKLKDEMENLKNENMNLKMNSKIVEEQRDKISLLKDSLDTKARIIEQQKKKIEEMSEKLKDGPILPEISFDLKNKDQKTLVDPWTQNISKDQPKKGKKAASASKKAKAVNVEELIKEDNRSFFNNLSFTNSSPVINEKKIRKDFKQ